ncbi:MAG: hypothetical protein HY875_04485 [Chloroflexi bacterium]|nr:hypothetical protein [Chloroflexota bacterium]
MKLVVLFAVIAVAGSAAGAVYGADLAAAMVPEAGSHGAWYASRSAGIASYVFLWVGIVGGLLMSSAFFDGLIGRPRLLAMHQSASIAGVFLGLAHALVLIPDHWTHFGLKDILVPFGSYYKPVYSAVGTLSLYLAAVVSASFWFRSRMGGKSWKMLHYTSFLAFGGALWHGLMMGTDAHKPWVLAILLGTSLSVIFGVMVRITYARPPVKRVAPAQAAASPATAATAASAAPSPARVPGREAQMAASGQE